MIIAVFRRCLKERASFEDFISAWEADEGFGVPARVFNAVSLDDPREILSIGFVDIDAAVLGARSERSQPRRQRVTRESMRSLSQPCFARFSTFEPNMTSQGTLARSDLLRPKVCCPRCILKLPALGPRQMPTSTRRLLCSLPQSACGGALPRLWGEGF